MSITRYEQDLPDDLDFGSSVAVDTEAMGLNPYRDRLCLVQLSAGDGTCHLVQFKRPCYDAPEPEAAAGRSGGRRKVFHFARFDVAILQHYLGVICRAGLLHQDRLEAGADLYRPARPQGSVPGTARRRSVEGAAEFGLGGGGADARRSSAMPPPMSCTCTRCASGSTPCCARERAPRSGARVLRLSAVRAGLDLAGWPDVDIFAY